MPELPDILLYVSSLQSRVVGARLESLRIVSPFVLRTFDPPSDGFDGKTLQSVERIGKRFVFQFEDDLFAVAHLMIAGRWRWSEDAQAKPPGKIGLASYVFDRGVLHLVESSQQKRASIHLMRGRESLRQFGRGGVDVLSCSLEEFADQLRRENHTLKRSLTDPRLFDGIGNAYSDEILHAAKLSPLKWTSRLSAKEVEALFNSTRRVLQESTERLRRQFAKKFPGPGDVTAFRPEFAIHGKFGQPCPVCGAKVQRIRYADNDTNYCPHCQTDGVVLADRSLSRLLGTDWPRKPEQWE